MFWDKLNFKCLDFWKFCDSIIQRVMLTKNRSVLRRKSTFLHRKIREDSESPRSWQMVGGKILEQIGSGVARGRGKWPPPGRHSAPPPYPNEITLCTEVYGEPPFWVPVSTPSPNPPCCPLILKKSGYAPVNRYRVGTWYFESQWNMPYTGKLCHRGKCHSGICHSGERWMMSRPFVHSGNLNFKHTLTNGLVFHNAWKRIICHFRAYNIKKDMLLTGPFAICLHLLFICHRVRKASSFTSPHYGNCHCFPRWHNFPVISPGDIPYEKVPHAREFATSLSFAKSLLFEV